MYVIFILSSRMIYLDGGDKIFMTNNKKDYKYSFLLLIY